MTGQLKILVTGGAGFIGSHLVERLLALGHEVTCLDNLDDYYDRRVKRANLLTALQLPRFHWVWGDVCDRELMEKQLRGHDAVVHLAARPGVRRSIEEPEHYARVNVSGTISVLEASRRCGVGHIVVASSSSVYGVSPDIPFREETSRLMPASPYGASKLAAEQFCQVFHHLYGIPVTSLRFFTVYGPRQRPDMAIHRFVAQIEEEQPIAVFGDGSSRRDYTYVDDVIVGVERSITRPNGYQVYNLGTTETVALRDLIATIERALGKQAILSERPDQPGDVPITYADIERATRDLDYRPRVGIEEGVRRFVEWFRSARTVVPAPAAQQGVPGRAALAGRSPQA